MPSLRQFFALPRRGVRFLLRPLQQFAATVGAKCNFLARVYYVFFDASFGREQRSFLAGVSAYSASLAFPSRGTLPLLRRNVHRLEKGLLMKPRRIPFALDYIGETVSAYVRAADFKVRVIDPIEMAWARDVLTEYFAVHEGEAKTAPWAEAFRSIGTNINSFGESPRIPYRRDLTSPPVSYGALAALAKRRRSVRWFLQKRVERELIDKALELGAQAPSACNRQPFEFRIFDDRELVKKVIDIPFGLAGYGHNVPVVAVVVGQQRHFFDARDRHLIYIDSSLAVMGFLLALETLGLSSCCVNWPDIETQEKKMSSLLGLSPDERPVMLLAIGYPDLDGLVANSTKKSLSQLRHFNFE